MHTESAGRAATGPWPFWLRVAFRFACLYFGLFCLPNPAQVSLLNIVPHFGDRLGETFAEPLAALAAWAGQHVFHLQGIAGHWHPTGSGDTALHYVLYGCVAAIAAFGTLIWTIVDRRRTEYRTCYAWLSLLLRFTLAAAMVLYGFSKVFPKQFAPPGLDVLTETYGDSTPMRLLWTFMGSSTPYRVACGLGEVLGGMLLLFRRTSTMGALLTAAIMSNVALLNFSYDVPVKLYSAHLLLVSLLLLLPDAGPIFRFFALRREAVLGGAWLPRFESNRLRWAAHVLQGLVVVCLLLSYGVGIWESTKGPAGERSELYGVWQVDSDPGGNGARAWQRVYFEYQTSMMVQTSDGTQLRYSTTYLPDAHSIELRGADANGSVEWTRPDPTHLSMAGNVGGQRLMMTMHRTSPEIFPLQAHQFHWVHEDAPNH